jgi:hypothetical protein
VNWQDGALNILEFARVASDKCWDNFCPMS